MEGTFSYQHEQASSTPMIIPTQEKQVDIEELRCASSLSESSFPHCYLFEAIAPYQNVPSPDAASKSIDDAKSDFISSVLDENSHLGVKNSASNNGRKRAKDESSGLTPSECKDSNGRRRKKQVIEEEKKKKEEMKAKLEVQPNGYIHVRARRGQATDSHSLAERVRRKKLSERMNLLQSLVPGCDNVIGKAQVLDVIINYVQSLQNQVEFLSLRLASMDQCMGLEYSFDQDKVGIGGMTHEQMSHEEIEQPSMSMSMSNSNGPTATGGALDCLIMSNSPSPSPPSHLFQPQDLDLTTNAAFFQEMDSDILGQFGEIGQDFLDQLLEFDNTF